MSTSVDFTSFSNFNLTEISGSQLCDPPCIYYIFWAKLKHSLSFSKTKHKYRAPKKMKVAPFVQQKLLLASTIVTLRSLQTGSFLLCARLWIVFTFIPCASATGSRNWHNSFRTISVYAHLWSTTLSCPPPSICHFIGQSVINNYEAVLKISTRSFFHCFRLRLLGCWFVFFLQYLT